MAVGMAVDAIDCLSRPADATVFYADHFVAVSRSGGALTVAARAHFGRRK